MKSKACKNKILLWCSLCRIHHYVIATEESGKSELKPVPSLTGETERKQGGAESNYFFVQRRLFAPFNDDFPLVNQRFPLQINDDFPSFNNKFHLVQRQLSPNSRTSSPLIHDSPRSRLAPCLTTIVSSFKTSPQQRYSLVQRRLPLS